MTFLELAPHLLDACADARGLLDRLEAAIRRGDETWINEIRTRYEAGRAEHADSPDNWSFWNRGRFTREIRQELQDAVIYAAEERRRWGA